MGKARSDILALLIKYLHCLNWLQVNCIRENGDTTQHRAVDDRREQCPTADERTFRCACVAQPSMPEEPRKGATLVSGWGRAADAWKKEAVAMGRMKSKWCDPKNPLAFRICFIDDSLSKTMGPSPENLKGRSRDGSRPARSQTSEAKNKTVFPREFIKDSKNSRRRYYGLPGAKSCLRFTTMR